VADLFYFPFIVNDWLGGEATSQMTPAQEGAFIRLLAISWQSKTAPCTLPNDDVALAQMSRLGAHWKKLGPFVKQQFELVDGRLRNRKLWAVYQDSLAKHERRANAGRLGAQARAQRGGTNASHVDEQCSSNATGNATVSPLANGQQNPSSHSHSHSHSQRTTTTSAASAQAREAEAVEAIAPLSEKLPAAYVVDAVQLLARVPSPQAWAAECLGALDGMHGVTVTPEQLGVAMRDYNANGAEPSLRHFRGYLRDATRPPRATNDTRGRKPSVLEETYANATAAMEMIPDDGDVT